MKGDMSNLTPEKRRGALVAILCLLAMTVLSCKLPSGPATKMNMFAGTNARDGAVRVTQKLGVGDPKLKYIEIHEDRIQFTVQDPAKPKNFDEYTYAKGVVSGPKPVEALVVGNQEFTADKTRLFKLSEIDLGLVPEVCRQAAERAQVEDGKPDLIFIDWASASLTQSKAQKEQRRVDEAKDFERQARGQDG